MNETVNGHKHIARSASQHGCSHWTHSEYVFETNTVFNIFDVELWLLV